MRQYQLSAELEAWIRRQTSYASEDLDEIFTALRHIPPHSGIRAFFFLGYRSILEKEKTGELETFDALLGVSELPKPMAFIPLGQGLTALLILAAMRGGKQELYADLIGCGRQSGSQFLTTSLGQALERTTDENLPQVQRQFNTLLASIYNEGHGDWEVLTPHHTRVILSGMGCPAIQHLVWRGSFEEVARSWGVSAIRIESGILGEDSIVVDLNYNEPLDPAHPPSTPLRPAPRATSSELPRLHPTTIAGSHGAAREAFWRWLRDDASFSDDEKDYLHRALTTHASSGGVRALYLSDYRAQLPEAARPGFDRVLGTLPDRAMNFISLKQGLTAVLFANHQLNPTLGLFDLLIEMGERLGQTLVSSSSGRALLGAAGQEFSFLMRQFNMLIKAFYDTGSAQLRSLEGRHASIVLHDLCCPDLQRFCWQGILRAVAQAMDTQLTLSTPEMTGEGSLSLEVRWREKSATPQT